MDKGEHREEITSLNDAVLLESWQDVGTILQRDSVPELQRMWAVEKASHLAGDQDFNRHILPHCRDDELVTVSRTALSRHMWISAGQLLRHKALAVHHKWILEKACQTADDHSLCVDVLPHCSKEQVDPVLQVLVTRCLWMSVRKILDLKGNGKQYQWISEEPSDQELRDYILPHCSNDQLDSIVTPLVTRCLWRSVVVILQRGVSDLKRKWAINEACRTINDFDLWDKDAFFSQYFLPHITKDQAVTVLTILLERDMWISVCQLSEKGFHALDVIGEEKESGSYLDEDGNDLIRNLPNLTKTEVQVVLKKLVLLCEQKVVRDLIKGDIKFRSVEIWTVDDHVMLKKFHQNPLILRILVGRQLYLMVEDLAKKKKVIYDDDRIHYAKNITSFEDFLNCVLPYCEGKIVDILLAYFVYYMELKHAEYLLQLQQQNTVINTRNAQPYFDFQCTTLGYTLARMGMKSGDRQFLNIFNRIAANQDLNNVLFKRRIKLKNWELLCLADLTHVWEEVRRELFQAAVKQGQWTVVKQWADHSLYHDQRCWAMQEARRHEQWEVYLQLADHGLNDAELSHVYYNVVRHGDWSSIVTLLDRGVDIRELVKLSKEHRCQIVSKNEGMKYKRRGKMLKCVKKIYMTMGDNSCQEYYCRWRAAMYQGVNYHSPSKSAALLDKALKLKHYHVVKYLIRHKLGARQRSNLFPQIVELQQWDVCRELIEKEIDVHACLPFLPQLLDHNQWIVVGRIMEYDVEDSVRRDVMQRAIRRREGSLVWLCSATMKQGFTEEEREMLFHQFYHLEVWQALKSVIETEDNLGLKQRQKLLRKAAEHHQWGVIDHCQRFNVDINIQEERKFTLLQAAALNDDWEAIRELVCHGANPSQLDSKGTSILYKAIESERWDMVKVLIEYHANLLLANSFSNRTPLHYLIDKLIYDNGPAEIIGHALMWSPHISCGLNDNIETTLHAVCAASQPEIMHILVARGVDPLAFEINGESVLMYAIKNTDDPQKMLAECIRLGLSTHPAQGTPKHRVNGRNMSSPVQFSIILTMPLVFVMIYESGACSNSELFKAIKQQHHVDTVRPVLPRYKIVHGLLLSYLKKVATSPRTLMSMCRLVISHAFNVRGKRHKLTDQLSGLLPASMIDYVLFRDLTDPMFGSQPDFLENLLQK